MQPEGDYGRIQRSSSGQDSISGIGPTRECVVKPDLVTWGSGITSCSASGRDKYAVKSGTSMSTPRIAGAAACMLEKDPRLTNREIKMLLRESARIWAMEKISRDGGF